MTLRRHRCCILIALALLSSGIGSAHGQTPDPTLEGLLAQEPAGESASVDHIGTSGKLLLTAGVSQLEGAAGGGLVPWAVIGGYGTRDQIGANAHVSRLNTQAYRLDSHGMLVGWHDRLELSFLRQRLDTGAVGTALGLGRGFALLQDVLGIKLKLAGDVVLGQDSWLPQVAIGAQYKTSDRGDVLAALGARSDHGTDIYLSATKLLLGQGLLLNGTLRLTKANQTGLLGFGGDANNDYRMQVEASAACLLSRKLALGAEYRTKSDNLAIAEEDDAWDIFVAWAPGKHLSITAAWIDLGDIANARDQHGLYASLQTGF